MLFKEKETEEGFAYSVTDVFGTIDIYAEEKLDGELLDDIVYAILDTTGTIVSDIGGNIATPKGEIEFEFDAKDAWQEDNEEELCENTPTSTLIRAKEFILTNLRKVPVISSLVKFVEVFRKAWKRM